MKSDYFNLYLQKWPPLVAKGGHFHHPLGKESLLFYAKYLPLALSTLRSQAAPGSYTKHNGTQTK